METAKRVRLYKEAKISTDSATIYRNEEDIGLALEELCPLQGIKRSDLFLTSKLAPKDQGYDSCVSSVRKSLQNLRTDYLDLYLIHWPGAGGIKVDDPSNATRRLQSWKALEHCYQMGLVRAIGVSNYCIHHLQEMEAYAEINPHVLQVFRVASSNTLWEFHFLGRLLYQPETNQPIY